MTKCFDYMECGNPDRCGREGKCASHEADIRATPSPLKAAADSERVRVPLTEAQIEHLYDTRVGDATESLPIVYADWVNFARAVEAAVHADAQAIIARLTSERDAAVRERNGLRARIDRAVNAAEEVFGQDAVRYKLSLFKNGRARNYFPEHMDGGWFAFQRAENDAHIGLCDEIVRLRAAASLAPQENTQ